MPVALVGLIRRNRRRYGGYIVHAGLAVLLVGVAASSSFQHSQDVVLSPGQKASVDGYTIRYVRPTESVSAPEDLLRRRAERVQGRQRTSPRSRPRRSFYPSQDPDDGHRSVEVLRHGNSDSDVGLDAGLRRDIWTVINVDPQPLQPG